MLPWLAWALSVDTWDSDWPESTKRRLIAESVQIHRANGTVAAIERVTDALGVSAELSEWFEDNAPPHTFRLTAWANANLVPDADVILSQALYRTLQQSIDNVKPVRSHYDFRIGAKFGSEVLVSCAGIALSYVESQNTCQLTINLSSNTTSIAMHANAMAYVRANMEFL